MITGLNRNENGRVRRLVRRGSLTIHRNRNASNGFDLISSGCDPSALASKPRGRSLVSMNLATSDGRTERPVAWLTADAICAWSRVPSIATRTT
jgi:hypothetical protein